MDFLSEMGARIKRLRQRCGLSQDDLARMCGYTSRSSINKVEKGIVDIPQSKISLIALALGVTPTYLMYGDDSPQIETPAPELTESERAWIELYRKLSPDVQETFVTMVKTFDSLPEGERQMLLAMIRGALGSQAK